MPLLSFRLNNPNLMFEATEKSDEWNFVLSGKCEQGWNSTSFTVKCGENSYDGFGADALLYIKKRRPRTEVPGISTIKPFDKDDEYRDIIQVSRPDSKVEQPLFQISVALPLEAYQRVIDTDWTKEVLKLSVETHLWEKILVYGSDPDGREIEWLADKQTYVFLEKVTVHFLSAPQKKLALKNKYLNALKNVENTLMPIEQMLASVEQATRSIGELRVSIIRAAWLLAAVVVVTALIR